MPTIRKGDWLGFVQTRSNFICEDTSKSKCAFTVKQNCIMASSKSTDERPYCLLYTGGSKYLLRLCFMSNGNEVYITLQDEIPERLRTRTTTIEEVRKWWYFTGIKILESIDD